MAISLREANETLFRLDIIKDLKFSSLSSIDNIQKEINELAKIFASIISKA